MKQDEAESLEPGNNHLEKLILRKEFRIKKLSI